MFLKFHWLLTRDAMIRHLVLILLLSAWAFPANADRRVALVIGNSAYRHSPSLENPRNDARDIAAVFRRLGFDVLEGLDLDHAQMRRIIRRFAEALTSAKAGVFFYAGHGLQVAGKNYLVPVDARLVNAIAIDFELIRLDLIHSAMEQSTRTNILFLDACRDNPLARNLSLGMGTRSTGIRHGLATVESGIGSLISFSTQPGNFALDGDNRRNSPYTSALIANLNAGHFELSDLLIRVRRDVMAMTKAKQVPWEHSSLTRPFYFNKVATPKASATTGPAGGASDPEERDWQLAAVSRQPDLLDDFVRQYPDSRYAPTAIFILEQLKSEQLTDRPASNGYDLTMGIQKELARLGCYTGQIDGKWGRRTRFGVEQINARFVKRYPIDAPSPATLNALYLLEGRLCSLSKSPRPRPIRKDGEPQVKNKQKTISRQNSGQKQKTSQSGPNRQNSAACLKWIRCTQAFTQGGGHCDRPPGCYRSTANW